MTYAVLELADAADKLRAGARHAGAQGDTSAPDLAAANRAALELIRDASARLADRVAGVPGLPVAGASEYLGVSEPTVRAWVARGILDTLDGAKPMLIQPASVRQVGRLVHELRERGQDRDWTQGLADLLHDRNDRSRPEVVQGLEELGQGNLEPA